MIYTVTLNPAVDYYLSFKEFNEGKLNSAQKAYCLSGGKGINVSKVLKNFKTTNEALGFLGGFTGEFIKTDLKENGIKFNFVELLEPTRINVKINNNGLETEIAGVSPEISAIEAALFLESFKAIRSGDILVLSGSVPKSLKASIYGDIISNLPDGVKVVLDTRGEAFGIALEKGVFLIKPNQHEIEEYFNKEFKTQDELLLAGKELQKLGAENVLISLGGAGSVLITKDSIYFGGVPKGKLISSVGAGDSMVAGFIYGVSKGKTLVEAYKYGIASGSGTAFSEGLVTLETMENLYSEIEIRGVK
ncbi:MAG: 1-phosphofructokinase [Fusobacteriaceae bacterium]